MSTPASNETSIPAAAAPQPEPTVADRSAEAAVADKARIKDLEAKLAQVQGVNAVIMDEKTAQLKSMQPAIVDLYRNVLPTQCKTEEDKRACAEMANWADELHNRSDVLAQFPLARTAAVYSATLKREREEASALSEASKATAATMKENEELKAQKGMHEQRIKELEQLAQERQENNEKMQAELAKHGLIAQKFDFSKVSSREKDAEMTDANSASSATADSALSEKVMGKQPMDASMQAVTSNASRGANGSGRLNPFEDDPLAAMISHRGAGGLRMTASGTAHAFLGAVDQSGDIAAILRSQ